MTNKIPRTQFHSFFSYFLIHQPTNTYSVITSLFFFFLFFVFLLLQHYRRFWTKPISFFLISFHNKNNKTVPKYPTDTKSHKQEWIKSPKQKDIYEAYACTYIFERQRKRSGWPRKHGEQKEPLSSLDNGSVVEGREILVAGTCLFVCQSPCIINQCLRLRSTGLQVQPLYSFLNYVVFWGRLCLCSPHEIHTSYSCMVRNKNVGATLQFATIFVPIHAHSIPIQNK